MELPRISGEERIELHDVEFLSETLGEAVCAVEGRRLHLPRLVLRLGSNVRRPGDRGTLTLPRSLAQRLGL